MATEQDTNAGSFAFLRTPALRSPAGIRTQPPVLNSTALQATLHHKLAESPHGIDESRNTA
ncbi:hypothetical protein N9B39_02895 [bacterium]|nr:hypothetical protein [bacterium]